MKAAGTDIKIFGAGSDIFNKGSMDLKFDGLIDFDAFEKTFPLKKKIDLEGRADMSISAEFNLADLKAQDYGRIQALGKFNLEDLRFQNPTDSLSLTLSSAEILTGQDQNSQLLTAEGTKVIGGKIMIRDLNFEQGMDSRGRLDTFEAKFASTPLKDTSEVATLKASVLIDNGRLLLGDSLKAKIKFLNGEVGLSPKEGEPKTPRVVSNFKIDSAGAIYKGKRVALIQGKYDISSTRVGKKWPLDGRVSFGTMYAFTPAFPLELEIPKTEIVLEPGLIELDHAKLKIGKSDLTATGRVYDIGDAFLEDKIFKGELEISSELIDVNEMIFAMNEGAAHRQANRAGTAPPEEDADSGEPLETSEPSEPVEPAPTGEPRSFVVPDNLDLRFQSRFKEVHFRTFKMKEVMGLITIKDQVINLSALQMDAMAAKLATSMTYEARERGKASLDFDFKLYEIDLGNLTELFPVIDSLLPMSESFEGKVNFRMKGRGELDQSMGMVGPSLDAIARIEGDDLVVLDGETFQKIAKMLFFKNKERNTIDKLEFAMVFQDAIIEVFPSVVTVDRYKVAIGGQHKLDMTYDYHFSILKSPMPFKAGIDVTGTDDDLKFKITKAKYKHMFSTKERQRKKADSTLIRRKNYVMGELPFYE